MPYNGRVSTRWRSVPVVSDVLGEGGGAVGKPQALLLGGYFGSWASYDEAVERPFSHAGLAQLGAGPGAGLLAVLPSDACGLVETARVARYLASESAGQCGPCVFGLPALAGELECLASGRAFDRARLERWLGQVDGRGSVSSSRRRGSHGEERPRGVRSRARTPWPWPLLRPAERRRSSLSRGMVR